MGTLEYELSDEKIGDVVESLASERNNIEHAKAQSDFDTLSKYEKILLARLRRQSNEKTIQGRDDYAHTHDEYIEWYEGWAVANETALQWKYSRAGAEIRMSAWQSKTRRDGQRLV